MLLKDSKEQRAILEALSEEGWKGTWKVKKNDIIISNTEGSLEDTLKKEPLSYFQALILALNLGTQITALATHGKGLLYITPKDITICQGTFIISNLERLILINNEIDEITLSDHVSDHGSDHESDLAPELRDLKTFPTNVSSSVIYYSIARLCLKSLNIDQEMKEIWGSKLYYLLERCLYKDPKKRIFLYI